MIRRATEERLDRLAPLVLLFTSLIVLLFATKSSPLYPLNDWVDANCFFTVGKGMWSGVVPYRDLLEQKGPVLYFLHMLASGISYRSFLGVFLLEVGAVFACLWYSYRAARLYVGPSVLLFMPVAALLIATSKTFAHGDSVEELVLGPLAFALFVGLRAVKEERLLSARESWAIGITAGAVFWMKYTLVGLYVGWFVVIAFLTLRQEGRRALLQLTGRILGGVLLMTFPILLYFGLHGALGDLFEAYFYNNLVLYAKVEQSQGMLANVRMAIKAFWPYMPVIYALTGAGVVWHLLTQPLKLSMHVLLQIASLVFFLFAGGRMYVYYALPMALFVWLGGVAIVGVCEWLLKRRPTSYASFYLSMGMVILCGGLSAKLSPNAYLRGTAQEEMPQYQFAQIMQKKPNATLLNYGFLDGGFYTTTGIVPKTRVFCALNLPTDALEREQNRYVREGKTDFIVTRNEAPDFPGYHPVATAAFYFEGEMTYTLYEKDAQ